MAVFRVFDSSSVGKLSLATRGESPGIELMRLSFSGSSVLFLLLVMYSSALNLIDPWLDVTWTPNCLEKSGSIKGKKFLHLSSGQLFSRRFANPLPSM